MRLRAWLPVAACSIAIVTIVLCFIISQSLGHDSGGLTWPYISDTGRDEPEHIIFAIGLTVAALLYTITWGVAVQFLRSLYSDDEFSSSSKCWLGTVLVMQILAGIGLALLAIFDTRDFPTVHLASAIAFFVLSIIATTIATVLYFKRANTKADEQLLRRAKLKVVVLAFVWIFFLIYIPIGLPLADSSYVEDTGLYDYSEDVSTNTMRSVTQFCCVVSLLVYMGSWTVEFREPFADAQ